MRSHLFSRNKSFSSHIVFSQNSGHGNCSPARMQNLDPASSFCPLLQRSLPEARFSDGVLVLTMPRSNNCIILFLHTPLPWENTRLDSPSSKSEGLIKKAHSQPSPVCLLEKHLSGWLLWPSISSLSPISQHSTRPQTAGHKGRKKSWILIFHVYHVHSSPQQLNNFFLFIKDNWEN